ncbi:GTP-binding protein [Streptomyces sp. NPDC050145]|uniref:GTP-binding protein n=1 Tax=Streptomyces sp. NPDC050145 TaxID=3365602 RepID=UPI0037BC7952
MRAAVVGAQGHGKSTLVGALPAALSEEFGPSPDPEGQFVTSRGPYHLHDCPGLDDFRSRLAVGVDQFAGVLLVVSAEDGPLPETRAYAAAAREAGVARIAVYVSKCDLVEAEEIAELIGLETLEMLGEEGYPKYKVPMMFSYALDAARDPKSKKGRRGLVQLAQTLDTPFR